jgi:hypothetical protein
VAGWTKSEKIAAFSAAIAAVSAAGAILVFGLGVSQYRASENWKRSEFVAAQIKEFNADKINRSVLLMMDYDPARVELFPEKTKVGDRYVDVEFRTLINAINKEKGTSEVEFQIRIYFEHLLTALSRFNYFLDSGAIEPKELCADFSYPVELMTGTAREMKLQNTGVDIAPFSKAVHDYLARWQYSDITNFLGRIQKACKQ